MRARWNELVTRVLGQLSREPGTAAELADELKAGVSNISTTLLRLTDQGHVERERIEDGEIVLDKDENITRPRYVFRYSITDKGKGRLARIAEHSFE
jgi:DNA-binding MarR family transcriptional regulator